MNTDQTLLPLNTISHTDDPDTSNEAAHSLGESRATMAFNLLKAYSLRALTAEEASQICGYTAWAGRKRVTDLKNAGLLQVLIFADEPVTRVGASGRRAQVLTITPDGIQAIRAGRV